MADPSLKTYIQALENDFWVGVVFGTYSGMSKRKTVKEPRAVVYSVLKSLQNVDEDCDELNLIAEHTKQELLVKVLADETLKSQENDINTTVKDLNSIQLMDD
eukprot:TRINITY_DN4217_c0_g1_i3.p1 TRINITY_DN4217_c0_g1~~TRINITY_DN4217_c0_g1_i3.p1  ORF type:complete len:103 (-),score=17.18 TRINITY_DN4217_c0_g1_i3:32-340(-)